MMNILAKSISSRSHAHRSVMGGITKSSQDLTPLQTALAVAVPTTLVLAPVALAASAVLDAANKMIGPSDPSRKIQQYDSRARVRAYLDLQDELANK